HTSVRPARLAVGQIVNADTGFCQTRSHVNDILCKANLRHYKRQGRHHQCCRRCSLGQFEHCGFGDVAVGGDVVIGVGIRAFFLTLGDGLEWVAGDLLQGDVTLRVPRT
ncbi:hypothetical protein, partial [Pseudomonas paraveronii]|uniref:hypothetical protein n=1 Tax=Pseudomonas paraveronii TaxID=3040598 RepID=UPI002AB08B8D